MLSTTNKHSTPAHHSNSSASHHSLQSFNEHNSSAAHVMNTTASGREFDVCLDASYDCDGVVTDLVVNA